MDDVSETKGSISSNWPMWVIGGLLVCAVVFFMFFKPAAIGCSIEKVAAIVGDARMSLIASEQDQNPLMSLMHVTSAIANLRIVSQLTSPDAIKQRFDIDLDRLTLSATEHQVKVLESFRRLAPRVALAQSAEMRATSMFV
jgi:hypothetical protein